MLLNDISLIYVFSSRSSSDKYLNSRHVDLLDSTGRKQLLMLQA